MTQREFERQIKKLVPTVKNITYGKNFGGKKFVYFVLYVHVSPNIHNRNCFMMMGSDCMEKMLKMFEELNESTN